MTNILFLCRYNRFRSKIAEAYFNKKSKKRAAKSAGFFPGIPLSKEILDCANSFGLKLSNTTHGVNHKLIMWSNKIIVIDNANSLPLFEDYIKNDKKKVIRWNIPDIEGSSMDKRKDTVQRIIKKIDSELLK